MVGLRVKVAACSVLTAGADFFAVTVTAGCLPGSGRHLAFFNTGGDSVAVSISVLAVLLGVPPSPPGTSQTCSKEAMEPLRLGVARLG